MGRLVVLGAVGLVLAAVVRGAVPASPPRSGSVVVARSGTGAGFAVVVREQASPSERTGAVQLVDYLQRVTGEKLALTDDSKPLPEKAILIGWTKHTPRLLDDPSFRLETLGESGFRIAVRGSRVLLVGSEVSGAMYAAFELLERFAGVRWFAPWHEVVPKREAVSLPSDCDEVQRPAIPVRVPFAWSGIYDGNFAAHMRLNGEGNAMSPKTGLTRQLFSRRLAHCHTSAKLFPPHVYFRDHPEYFALVDGRRDERQMCFTNPDVYRLTLEKIRRQIAEEPRAKVFGVSQNDCGGWCQCEGCRKVYGEEGAQSGTIVRFINRLAAELRKDHPDVFVQTLAYQYTEEPPKRTKLGPGTIVQFCATDGAQAVPYHEHVHAGSRLFARRLKEWGSGEGQVDTWDYPFNSDWQWWAYPNFKALKGNIKYDSENRLRRLFFQSPYTTPVTELASMRTWCVSKWMWNPDLDFWTVVDEFCDGFYGAGAPYVKDYLRLLYENHERNRDIAKFPMRRESPPPLDCFPDSFLARADELWTRAREAAQGDPVCGYHVRMDSVSVDFMRFYRFLLERPFIVADRPERIPGYLDAVARVRRMEQAVVETRQRGLGLVDINHDGYCMSDCPIISPALKHFHRAYLAGRGASPARLKVGSRGFQPFAPLTPPRDGWEMLYGDPAHLPGYQLGAIKVLGDGTRPVAELLFSRIGADEGQRVRIRLRLRVERRSGAPEGEALRADVVDGSGKVVASRIVRTEDVGEDYRWIDLVVVPYAADLRLRVRMGDWDRAKASENPAVVYTAFESVEIEDADRPARYLEAKQDPDGALRSLRIRGDGQELVDSSLPCWGSGSAEINGRRQAFRLGYTRTTADRTFFSFHGEDGFHGSAWRSTFFGGFVEHYFFINASDRPVEWKNLVVNTPFAPKADEKVELLVEGVENVASPVPIDNGRAWRVPDHSWKKGGTLSFRWKVTPRRTPAGGPRAMTRAVVPFAGREPSLVPDGEWTPVFHDEFDGNRLDDSKWGYRTNFWGARAKWFALPSDGAVEVTNGLCRLKVVKLPNGQFVSPQLQTGELLWDKVNCQENPSSLWPFPKREKPRFQHRFGFYECRCKVQRKPGWWSAFWMQAPGNGATLDPATSGIEHDIMECFIPGEIIRHCFHMNGYGKDYVGFNSHRVKSGSAVDNPVCIVGAEDFHRYGLLWEEDGYTFFIDGVQSGEKVGCGPGEAVSKAEEFILLTTEVKWYRRNRGHGEGVPELEAAWRAGDAFEVDYVRVFDRVR